MSTRIRSLVAIITLTLMLLTLSGQSVAQDPLNSERLQIDTDNAAVWHGDDWDNRYTDPGGVIYHDGQFHMFRNGFLDWPAEVQIGYTISDDGITWQKQGEDPVLRTDEISYAGVAALASSILVEDDGTWVMYFYTWPKQGEAVGGIGRATAPSPDGPWTPDEALVLTPGDRTDWDGSRLASPSVVKIDDQYLMYYYAPSVANGTHMIGLATSEDGINWVKYDDPATGAPFFGNSDPVFTPQLDNREAWDAQNIIDPNVVQAEGGLVMMYKAFTGSPSQENQAVGLAFSEDGINWTRLNPDEPLFSTRDINRRQIWFSELVHHDGNYYVYLELQRNYLDQTDIYAGVLEGPLLSD